MKTTVVNYLILLFGILFVGCQDDEYVKPQAPVNAHTVTFPNELVFNFWQQSLVGAYISPYDTEMLVESDSNASIEANYQVEIYTEKPYLYKNLILSKNYSAINDTLYLGVIDSLVNDENLRVVILSVNNQAHPFSGKYRGDANFYETADSSFVKSFPVSGTVDHVGYFLFQNLDIEDSDTAILRGNFNQAGRFSANIISEDETLYAQLENDTASFFIEADRLSGTAPLSFNDGGGGLSQQYVQINLTKINE